MAKSWYVILAIVGIEISMILQVAFEKNVSVFKVIQEIPEYSYMIPNWVLGTLTERVRLEFRPTPPQNVRYIETEIFPLKRAPESPDDGMFARYGSAVQMDVTPLLNVQDGDYVAIRFKGGYYHGRVVLFPKNHPPYDKGVSFAIDHGTAESSSVLINPHETHTYFRVELEGFPGYVIESDSSGIGRVIRGDEFSAILEKMREQP